MPSPLISIGSRYQSLEQLGEGRNLVVYKALDISLDRYVVVLIFLPPEEYSESFRNRFEAEARVLAARSTPDTPRAKAYWFDGIIGSMKAYSNDLRKRVVESVESGECNIPEAARRYKVSEPSIERWLARQRKTGTCAPLPHAGGTSRKLATAEAAIRAAVKVQPDATLQELCEAVEKETKIKSGASMMQRELVRLELPRKKSRSMPASGTHRG